MATDPKPEISISDLTEEAKNKLVEEALKARTRRTAYNKARWEKIAAGGYVSRNGTVTTKDDMYAQQKKHRTKAKIELDAVKAELEALKAKLAESEQA